MDPAPPPLRWPRRHGRRRAALALIVAAAVAAAGCASEVGDACSVNLDCSPTGDRICDTAQRGGYCTLAGCGPRTCPDEAVCVRFFDTAFLSTPCDPRTEDAVGAGPRTDDCGPEEICLQSGFCAGRTQERRFCMRRCESDGDCRDGYRCRATGTRGAEPLIDPADPKPGVRRFCGEDR